MERLLIFILGSTLLLSACTSRDKKLYLDSGANDFSQQRCGTQSFVNLYATYRCSSLELEDSNDYISQTTPLHNIKGVVVNRQQRLLVVDEKLFGARPRADQEIVCRRRLKVVLNPGSGYGPNYQTGWITYQPNCLRFYNVKPSNRRSVPSKLFSKSSGDKNGSQ